VSSLQAIEKSGVGRFSISGRSLSVVGGDFMIIVTIKGTFK
jgi:hypothetical protein